VADSVKPRRRYESPRRRQQAQQTRDVILDAAQDLFTDRGYTATAMPAIAAGAGVALKTVYLAFGTKAGVLHALWDVRLGGDDQPIPIVDRPWYRELLQADDPHTLLRTAARQSRQTKDRAGAVMRIVRTAALTDPAIADLWQRIETEFRTVLRGFAQRLDELAALTAGIDVTTATDILWTLNHPDTWYLLVHRCGWTADRYEQWVGDTLLAQLLGHLDRTTEQTQG
jgi:AcrR family transcriptional regulator